MNMATIRNKLVEVRAAARVIVQRYGHTPKFAKHPVALVIKQIKGFTDEQLAEFLGTDLIGKQLGYEHKPNPSTFSKVRKRSDPRIFQELYIWLLQNLLKGKQLHLIAQDSTDIPAYSKKDKDARYGHKTPSKKEQVARKKAKKEYVFGYKLHASADAELEVPLVSMVAPANKHDKTFFHKIYGGIKSMFTINYDAKYLLDAAYDSTDIYQELHYDNIKPVIATNGRGFYKSKTPKDPDYGKRWAVERIFSRLKEVLGLARNRFVGIKKVAIFAFSCLIAYLVRYVM
jgi:hypothetical protein